MPAVLSDYYFFLSAHQSEPVQVLMAAARSQTSRVQRSRKKI